MVMLAAMTIASGISDAGSEHASFRAPTTVRRVRDDTEARELLEAFRDLLAQHALGLRSS